MDRGSGDGRGHWSSRDGRAGFLLPVQSCWWQTGQLCSSELRSLTACCPGEGRSPPRQSHPLPTAVCWAQCAAAPGAADAGPTPQEPTACGPQHRARGQADTHHPLPAQTMGKCRARPLQTTGSACAHAHSATPLSRRLLTSCSPGDPLARGDDGSLPGKAPEDRRPARAPAPAVPSLETARAPEAAAWS